MAFKTLNGRIGEVDRQGYGKIFTPGGEVVHFTLSQVKTPAGTNVGSTSYSQEMLGETVRAAVKDAGDGVLVAQSVTIVDGDKWLRFALPKTS